MNSIFKGTQREALQGKKIIIAIVVVTSAISFTLGYFVGKAVMKGQEPQPQTIAMSEQHEETMPEVEEHPAANMPKSPSPALTKGRQGVSIEKKEESSDDRYTVQAGAFKNLKDAENLKHKLEKKGYKVYIKKTAIAKNARLYKIRTGEFINRKDAETLALKLKNEEGLKAFVTPKNEAAQEKDKNLSRAVKQEKLR